MNGLLQDLGEHGGGLLLAATSLLALGCIGMSLQRSPIHRQRAGEIAILGVLVLLILACVPLPRYRLSGLWSLGPVASNRSQPAGPVESPPPVYEPFVLPAFVEPAADEPRTAPPELSPLIAPAADEEAVNVAMPPEFQGFPAAPEPQGLPETEPVPPTADEGHATGTLEGPPSASVSPSASFPPAFSPGYPLSMAYAAGAFGCLAWLVFGRVLLVRMSWSAAPPEPWLRRLYEATAPLRGRRPRLLISDRCARALSFGVWRPTIVLPGSACHPDRAGPLRCVLLHELAHVRQRDGWGHLLFNVAFPLLYFHPLYWWIRSRAYLAAELIADDWAAEQTAKEPYVEALIALAKGGGRHGLACFGSPQIFGSRSQFYRRMQMLLDRKTRLAPQCSTLWRLIYPTAWLLAVALVAGAVGVQPVEAQSDEPAVADDEPVAESSSSAEEAAEPAVEATAETVAEPPEPSPAPPEPHPTPPELVELRSEGEMLRAERAQLQKQLRDLLAAVANLRRELEALKAQAAMPRPSGLEPGKATLPKAPSRPEAPPAAPSPFPVPPTTTNLPVPPEPPVAPRATVPTPGPAAPAGFKPRSAGAPGASENTWAKIEAIAPRSTGAPGASPLPARAPGRAAEDTQVDLIRLATSLADAVGEVQIAQIEHASRKELAEGKAVSAHELNIAEIRLQTARRKVHLLRSIAEAALMSAEAELAASKRRFDAVKKERPSDESAVEAARARVVRAESRLMILKSILETAAR